MKEQLHNICVYTADRELRAFMVSHYLWCQNKFSPVVVLLIIMGCNQKCLYMYLSLEFEFIEALLYFLIKQVEELERINHLASEDLQKVEFIKQIENLCSRPATRCSKPFDEKR